MAKHDTYEELLKECDSVIYRLFTSVLYDEPRRTRAEERLTALCTARPWLLEQVAKETGNGEQA